MIQTLALLIRIYIRQLLKKTQRKTEDPCKGKLLPEMINGKS